MNADSKSAHTRGCVRFFTPEPVAPAAHALGEEKLPDEDGYGYTYRFVTRDTIEITSYSGYESEVVVPAAIDGYTVVGIQSFHATEGYSDPNVVVRKVTLPDTVTYIADDAFYDSDDWSAKTHSALREIVLPQSLKTIGERAFYHNYYLEKITIPASVTEIGSGAFAACTNLSDITIQGEHTLLHGGAFGARTSYSVGTFAGQLSALYNDWLYDDSASGFFRAIRLCTASAPAAARKRRTRSRARSRATAARSARAEAFPICPARPTGRTRALTMPSRTVCSLARPTTRFLPPGR